MSSEADTLPTLQRVIEEMRAGFASIGQRFDGIEQRLDTIEATLRVQQETVRALQLSVAAIEHQLEQMDIRLDRIESVAYGSHSQLMNLRADMKEFKAQFNQPA